MIKVNYDKETGKVIAFNRNIAPYIEITEEERRKPLPDKYSYYCVVDGKFTIANREPTKEERKADKEREKRAKKKELDTWLNDTEILFQLLTGEIKDTDSTWLDYKEQRKQKRKERKDLEKGDDSN